MFKDYIPIHPKENLIAVIKDLKEGGEFYGHLINGKFKQNISLLYMILA